MEDTNKKPVAWLDGLKAWGIFFVVTGHAFGAACHLSTGLTQQVMEGFYKYIYAFHMPLFFFIAGITFRSQLPFLPFVKKKACRLLIPYFVFGAMSILAYCLFSGAIFKCLATGSTTAYYEGKGGVTYWQMVLNLFLGGWSLNWFVYNSVLWFIPVLFSLELLFYHVDRYGSRLLLMAVIVCAVPLGWWLRYHTVFPMVWGVKLSLFYLPYFALGRIFGIRTILPARLPFQWRQGLAWVALLVSGAVAVLNPWQYLTGFPAVSLTMLSACFCIISWVNFCQVYSSSSFAVSYIGASTLGIMLMHKFPLLFIQNYFPPTRHLFSQSVGVAMAACLLVSLIAMGLSIGGCVIIRRTMPSLLGESK